jgi:predicted HTH transcriptional regulator
MFDVCSSAETPAPQIRYKPNDFWLEFSFSPVYREVIGSDNSVKNVGEKLDEKLGKRKAAIIRLMIKNSNITVIEVGKNLGISRTAADNNIQVLKKKG